MYTWHAFCTCIYKEVLVFVIQSFSGWLSKELFKCLFKNLLDFFLLSVSFFYRVSIDQEKVKDLWVDLYHCDYVSCYYELWYAFTLLFSHQEKHESEGECFHAWLFTLTTWFLYVHSAKPLKEVSIFFTSSEINLFNPPPTRLVYRIRIRKIYLRQRR